LGLESDVPVLLLFWVVTRCVWAEVTDIHCEVYCL
jgi:hypothetical protein